jgi:hypothetical protein
MTPIPWVRKPGKLAFLPETAVADTPSSLTERIGVTAVQQIIHNDFHWFFREQTVSDHGVDVQIKELDQQGKATGKLIALQIKTDPAYFRKRGDDYVYYGELRHLDYWENHSLPCYVIMHNPETGLTLWQKVERRLANVTEKGWSMSVPASNVLNASAKQYFERELASDPEAIRRFNMAFDLELMRKLNGREVYFEVNDWVNKSLNIRDVGVMFDEAEKDAPDFMIPLWAPCSSLFDFMSRFFPWLDYEYLEVIDEMAIGGTCIVQRGGGNMQNTGLDPIESPTTFRCVYSQASSDFAGEAHAVCVRKRL